MTMQEEWKEQQERDILFGALDAGKLALHLLKIGPTNRVVTAKQAKLLIAVRLAGDRLAWSWLGRFANLVEEYQLTVGEPLNARQAFLEAMRVEVAEQQKEVKL